VKDLTSMLLLLSNCFGFFHDISSWNVAEIENKYCGEGERASLADFGRPGF